MKVIIWGLLVHVLLLFAAFDIYFSSPVDRGMQPVKTTDRPPAKRLVLFVADGLRAEAMIGKKKIANAPNLNAIRELRGSWGISHTRVPTESRPGHVAMLAGIFEDPAAILKGWTANPVDFDSVVNESTNAWCWGSPDIVNMFNKENREHIHVYTYDAKFEDFGNENTIALDKWVFDRVESFIARLKDCKHCANVHQNGNLFFMHLLGIDTAGHGFKPQSKEYLGNLKAVDAYIPKIERMFEEAFPDNSTAYIFTSDHGMTDWGSHGAGSDHETETPFIAWGSGIRIDNYERDINQTDIATLIASLIGIPIPTNSIGTLPYQFINTDVDNIATMLISNVKQLYEIFKVKYYRRKEKALHFKLWRNLTPEVIDAMLIKLIKLKQLKKYGELKNQCFELMYTLKRATNYYHNYYQLPILTSMTVGLIFWIIYLAMYNISYQKPTLKQRWCTLRLKSFVFIPIYIFTFLFSNYQELPIMYYFYFLFPFFAIQVVAERYYLVVVALRSVKEYGCMNSFSTGIAIFAGLRLIVRGFRNRHAYSSMMFLVAAYIVGSRTMRLTTNGLQKTVWIMSCLIMSWFPTLPVMSTTFCLSCYLTGYAAWWVITDKLVEVAFNFANYQTQPLSILRLQQFFLKITPIYALCVAYDVIPVDSSLKYLAWFLAVIPVILCMCTGPQVYLRTTSIILGFAPFYFMLTTNYETCFLIVFVLLLYVWMVIESSRFGFANVLMCEFTARGIVLRRQSADDFRRAFFFVAFLFVSFFGTGNITSVSSFDPMWVRCFLTVFDPFRMGGLILMRICVPFIYLTVILRAINSFRLEDTFNIFILVMMYSDVMVLELLYSIRNIGSWLEIGMSLSQFIIMEGFIVLMLILYALVYCLTTFKYKLDLTRVF